MLEEYIRFFPIFLELKKPLKNTNVYQSPRYFD